MEILKTSIKNYFKELRFIEESHSYYVNGEKIKKSVSKMIGHYYKPFDDKKLSEELAEKNNEMIDVTGGFTGFHIAAEEKTASTYTDKWQEITKEACDRGHDVHLFGEHYPYHRDLEFNTNQKKQIKAFWDSLPSHIVPLFTELQMYHKIFLFAGTADILLYDTKKKCIIIADYKTNKDLFKNFAGKTMLGRFSNLLDNPFNHYQLQLSYYQLLLERALKDLNLDIKITRRTIIYLPLEGEYKLYNTDDYTELLSKDMKFVAQC